MRAVLLPGIVWLGLWLAVATAGLHGLAAEFPTPYDTEKSRSTPDAPSAAAAGFRLPPGFITQVFAAEPEVRQPVAMTFDGRGRLWVAENYTYAESGVRFATNLKDRIVIFQDADGDGRAESRSVFWDQAHRLTTVEVGLGGVFALCPPQLLFLPDRNGDDRPDGPPEVLLDGFAPAAGNHHTFANGLKWGPDGWLWGRIGISSGALVGRPGEPEAQRVELRGGIWRYHPGRKVVEVVCHGTTNPWGLDWNAVGEPFFVNTVIGHFWHAIPGAHFQRMHGEDVMPQAYALLGQHADHYHFDTGAGWTKSRPSADGSPAAASDALGGGHAHTGLLIYQESNWPAEYRGGAFLLNFHGRRINQERLERAGSGYVARHAPDFGSVGDPWFRGLDLIAGPEGGVYVNDWSDTGECHDSDGVHRSSGRIYRVTYGQSAPAKLPPWSRLALSEVAELALAGDEWQVRQARRELARRSPELEPGLRWAVAATLRQHFSRSSSTVASLRSLWALVALDATTPDWLLARTGDEDEHVRSWAVRLLAERLSSPGSAPGSPGLLSAEEQLAVTKRFARMAAREPSPLVRLYLASALPRLSPADLSAVGLALMARGEDVTDHNLGLLLWYGLESAVASDPDFALAAVRTSRHPVLRRHVTRRLAEDWERQAAPLGRVLAWAVERPADELADVVEGLHAATRGWRRAVAPPGWSGIVARSERETAGNWREQVRELAVLFGDGRALDDLRLLVVDPKADPGARRRAVRTLVEARAEGVGPFLRRQVDDGTLRVAALVGLLELDDPEAALLAGGRIQRVAREERPALVAAMAARPASAGALLDALAAGQLAREELSPYQARRMAGLGDPVLKARLGELWGGVQVETQAQRAALERWRQRLTPERWSNANLTRGKELFTQSCAPCHRLYGRGGELGPDLTGSGRANLDYLLENLLLPSAVVPAGYRTRVLTLKDGRVLTGLVTAANERTLTLLAPGEQWTGPRSEVVRNETLDQSLMPDGLLDGLSEADAVSLLAYLQRPTE